nr:uncharacterized protein LOC101262413 isoform X2 [Solanum lycopersicum]
MLRLLCRTSRRCCIRLPRRRFLSSSSRNSVDIPNNINNPHLVPSPKYPPIRQPQHPTSLSRYSVFALSATLITAIVSSCAVVLTRDDEEEKREGKGEGVRIYDEIENVVGKSNESLIRIVDRMKKTGAAASVLWKSLRSVMSSANHEVRVGFELRVAALLADIAAASESRRAALVAAGGGGVVDWLLETVAMSGENCWTQAEAARALAYLIADPIVCEDVLGRPHAVPYLLRFIFSAQPRQSKKHSRRSSFDLSDSLKGRSMLVAAIMDVVTSHCESADKLSFKPTLPKNAEMRDIAAAIEVIEEGGMHWDEPHAEDDDGGEGMKGIGMKILEGTTAIGLSRTNGLVEMGPPNTSQTVKNTPSNLLFNNISDSSSARSNMSSAVVPGLWDDLHSEQVAVPFAAWALANWAMASEVNRYHIQELDQEGYVVMAALVAPERSVKWHGSLMVKLLLEDHNLPLSTSVSDWTSSLLSTVSHASKTQDIPLAQIALSAFLISLERSPSAQEVAVEKGLHLMREAAKQTTKHSSVQEALAKALELLCAREWHMSLEESQHWSGVLLPWVFGQSSSDAIRSSAIKILTRILEDYGPSSIPISQGWLTIMLSDVLESKKTALSKGNNQPKSDKVKTQVDQANVVLATQTANQLAGAVVNLVGTQLGIVANADDTHPLADLLSLEPFAGPLKNLKKDKLPKIDAADSAVATLKGIKALTEICAEDTPCQNKIADYGGLCLLRRLLLDDDYEQLAAIEAYDASRASEGQDRVSTVHGEASTTANQNDASSLRVPPTGHIRKHAARLLNVLSVLPKVKKELVGDKEWCEWLEECANGGIPGCNDPKIRSYARATLLNIFCDDEAGEDSVDGDVLHGNVSNKEQTCPRYADMILLINPELPHWKCVEKIMVKSVDGSSPGANDSAGSECTTNEDINIDITSTSASESENISQFEVPLVDVVFIHGLRGGPFKTWRLSDDKSSTKSGLVEKIDEEAGREGTFWPGEWLPSDFPHARLFSVKYKSNPVVRGKPTSSGSKCHAVGEACCCRHRQSTSCIHFT